MERKRLKQKSKGRLSERRETGTDLSNYEAEGGKLNTKFRRMACENPPTGFIFVTMRADNFSTIVCIIGFIQNEDGRGVGVV
jgi:hypothetical protein